MEKSKAKIKPDLCRGIRTSDTSRCYDMTPVNWNTLKSLSLSLSAAALGHRGHVVDTRGPRHALTPPAAIRRERLAAGIKKARISNGHRQIIMRYRMSCMDRRAHTHTSLPHRRATTAVDARRSYGRSCLAKNIILIVALIRLMGGYTNGKITPLSYRSLPRTSGINSATFREKPERKWYRYP